MKILLVSWSTLPNKGGSSIIVENLAKNFSREELVVLGSKTLFQKNDVKRPVGGPEFIYFWSELYFMGRGYRYFIWFRKWRLRPLIEKIKSLIKTKQITHVVGVYPNPFYCHAACIAAREMQVPFSSYFHNTYLENVAITDPKAEAIQKEIFEESEHIFVMSKGMQRFYEKKYQLDKFKPLIHTFNAYPENISNRSTDKTQGTDRLPGTNKKHYKLVAIGNFNESNMDASARFADAIRGNPKYSLSLYTHVPKVLLNKRGLDTTGIEYKGFVDPDEVHQVLQEYDICVLTHGFTGGYGEIEYQTIFPTRTIPLLLSGKPIIAHSPNGSFLNDFINENNCAALVTEASKEAILNSLEKITTDENYQQELAKASKATVKKFYGPSVALEWKTILSS
ncbi:MAG: hypothetical protein AB8F74_16165 [Saprospiraceae bacterium]